MNIDRYPFAFLLKLLLPFPNGFILSFSFSQMNIENVARIWGPIMLRSSDSNAMDDNNNNNNGAELSPSSRPLKEAGLVIEFVLLLIEKRKEIFE